MQNLFANLPDELPEELIESLHSSPGIRIERIVSQGQASPEGFWYDLPHREWVVVLQGMAKLRFEDETVNLQLGDYLLIEAHRRHRVEWTTPEEQTIWLAIHFGESIE